MNSTATNQQIAWFYQRYKEESLELSPDFQRNPVWIADYKNYLIETLLLALPIPEIYVVNRVSLEGDSKWIVVDGQQRLRTILEFVTGELRVQIGIDSYQHIKRFGDVDLLVVGLEFRHQGYKCVMLEDVDHDLTSFQSCHIHYTKSKPNSQHF